MSPDNPYNRDLSARLADLIAATNIDSVMEQQPVRWRPATWQNRWRMDKLPHPHVLDELQEEYAAHGKIQRSFVFAYQGRSPVELFIAAIAWGLGPDNRGPAKIGSILARSAGSRGCSPHRSPSSETPLLGVALDCGVHGVH